MLAGLFGNPRIGMDEPVIQCPSPPANGDRPTSLTVAPLALIRTWLPSAGFQALAVLAVLVAIGETRIISVEVRAELRAIDAAT